MSFFLIPLIRDGLAEHFPYAFKAMFESLNRKPADFHCLYAKFFDHDFPIVHLNPALSGRAILLRSRKKTYHMLMVD